MQEMFEMWVWSLGREDPLEEGMANHFRILAWEIPWTEEPGGQQSMGSHRVRLNLTTKTTTTYTTWTARRSSKSILKEINSEYSLEGLMLKLKLQYFGHLIGRTNSLEKTLMLRLRAGGEGGGRGWDDWMASPTQWMWNWANLGI